MLYDGLVTKKGNPEVQAEYLGRGFGGKGGHVAPPILKLYWEDGGFCIWNGSRWMIQFSDGRMVEARAEDAKKYDLIVGRSK